jgi:homocysteine S-methyltransferase
MNPIEPFLEQQGFLILDGGLATELERAGFDLGDSLWSARLLTEAPEAIEEVHLAYLQAGADCLISASYQASIQGFMSRGTTEKEAIHTVRKAVELAVKVRDGFWSKPENRVGRLKPLVAASVGPYGAYLANGAEFTGDYDLDENGLYDFHRQRWELLSSTPADLLACETIPSFDESRALRRLQAESHSLHAWFSFSCRDGTHISDGTPITRCVSELSSTPRIVATGINCTAPEHILSLVKEVRTETDKPIIVYPNSGEVYDANHKCWTGTGDPETLAQSSRSWYEAGACLLGGCCRTRPEHIRRIRQELILRK